MDEELVKYVAQRLASLDGKEYWKHNFCGEAERMYLEMLYEKDATRFLTVMGAVEDYKNQKRNS